MAERTENVRPGRKTEEYSDYTEEDLQVALQEFLEEEKPAKEKARLWNIRTIVGLGFIFVATSYLIRQLGGVFIGPNFDQGWIYWLPIVGGIFITIVGFGFFSKERKQARINKRKRKKLYNNLNQNDSGSFDSTKRASASRFGLESYALRKNKKMFRSRTDKRIRGVCGGIAKYFGISSTFVRLFFAIFTLLGYGFPIILYIALCFILPKEPAALLRDDTSYNDF